MKAIGLQLGFTIFQLLSNEHTIYNKHKFYKTLYYWSRDILNFGFLEKGLGIVVSLSHFVYDFSTEVFLMSYPINWPNFIVWLLLLLEILDNTCIAIVC